MDLIKKFQNLYEENRQIKLLSLAYGVISVVTLIICGLLALINQALGLKLLVVPGVCALGMIMNIVLWSLIRTGLEGAKEAEKNNKKSK